MKPQFSTVRRSTRTGYVGSLANWTGTPRQLAEIAGWVKPSPESRNWFRLTLAFGAGFTAALLWLTR